jgi:hypothetical protein
VSQVHEFRDAAIEWVARGGEDARTLAIELAPDVDAVILVEGVSDAAAVEALAHRTGRTLAGVCVIPMGGVTNVTKFVRFLSPFDIRLTGLCDVGEQRYFEHVMPATDYFVCRDDLEAELIRSLGTDRVIEVLDEHGDLRAFRTFQNQPAQRSRALDRQLRRFLGTTSGRKERYAAILIGALDPMRIPAALENLLHFVD